MRWSVLFVAAIVAIVACGPRDRVNDEAISAYALEYGHSTGFKYAALVKGAPEGERRPISWFAWLLVGKGRRVLVDTGFTDRELAKRFRFDRFETVPSVLGRLGVEPAAITDVILTHAHWDHVGNLAPYNNARFWMQRDELAWARKKVGPERPRRAGVRLEDVEALGALEAAGRLSLIDGEREIFPGVRAHVGARHTARIQWLEVATGGPAGTVVIASDIAYLYENLDRRIPPGASADPRRDLEQIERMLGVVSSPRFVIPGHDPEVAWRFERVADGAFLVAGGR
jgi:glyoxylase-like metal-dependent hydrolase (beta-lactamase superfamily II)